MRFLIFMLAFSAFSLKAIAQADSVDIYTIDSITVKVENNTLSVTNKANDQIYIKNFSNPSAYAVDLDEDGVTEFLVNDYTEKDGQYFYTLYIFNAVDSFYMVDSIYSGLKEPYYMYSEELKGMLLITGSPDFDYLNINGTEDVFSPIICWKYSNYEVNIINDQLYEIFISENENNLRYIEQLTTEKGKDCDSSNLIKAAIASVYANFIYADEESNAEQVLNEFYNCKDLDAFRKEIKENL